MIKAICVSKMKDKTNRIVSYDLKDINGKVVTLPAEKLKSMIRGNQIVVVNLTLTSDNRLMPKDAKSEENNTPKQPVKPQQPVQQQPVQKQPVQQSTPQKKLTGEERLKQIIAICQKKGIEKEFEYQGAKYRIENGGITLLKCPVTNGTFNIPTWTTRASRKVGDEKWESAFVDCENIKLTGSIKDAQGMFYECKVLQSVDLNELDTSNVTDMSYMFYGCWSLTDLNIKKMNTSNVKTMKAMFSMCNEAVVIDCGFSTPQVTDMSYMFAGCSSMTTLNIVWFNTSRVTNMSYMFAACVELESLDLRGFELPSVRDMSNMFANCEKLTRLESYTLNAPQVRNLESMFDNCPKLDDLLLNRFTTSNVTNMRRMFAGCTSLTDLRTESFDISHADTTDIFLEDENLNPEHLGALARFAKPVNYEINNLLNILDQDEELIDF